MLSLIFPNKFPFALTSFDREKNKPKKCNKSNGGEETRDLESRALDLSESNPPPCHKLNLCSVAMNLTLPHLLNSQLVCLLPVKISNKFQFDL